MSLRALLDHCAATILFVRDGRAVTLAEGCIPALVDFSFEDKEAKGLRRLRDATPHPPQYFSALEVAQDAPVLLLVGEAGSGKTVLARRLALHLAGEALGDARFNLATLASDVPRDEAGTLVRESWAAPILPHLLTAPVATLPDDGRVIIDEAETLGEGGAALLADLAARGRRAILLGDAEACGAWPIPPGVRRHRLLPFLPAQRAAWRARHGGPEDLPAHPGMMSLAVAGVSLHDLAPHAATAFAALRDGVSPADPTLGRRFVLERLAARHIATLPVQDVAQLAADRRWHATLRHLRGDAPLAEALLATRRSDLAVLAADIAPPIPALRDALAAAIARDDLALPARIRAGRHLARLGDPRDLAELVAVPGGDYAMGSALHPNSAPPHRVTLAPFRIARFPVTNALYARFVDATGRAWTSADGRDPTMANAPATDLSWHDVRAFCAWLTPIWRDEGRIAAEEIVRLPTEPEWEGAARGAQPAADAQVYPWSGPWAALCCNSEEAGLNDRCAVGLFPAGRSPFGCDDMAGQVWEWCSTNWGEDMATPTFRYPYDASDGREDADAAPSVRRVLRGGCFSSGAEKATCTYRGSLEPAGSWRGNGFRVVISRPAPAPRHAGSARPAA
ncbi:SUMF1/EgtB/PvdO family nonheme iron enzyme [Roseomonas sp. AR75]|uniref:SUMF1/EgtB/PvdO family nonheme iron enzyme n=1 Tax=Roseomonas sp. AR75 TaxID=2562311 RepID=UPI0010C0D982|nr:SUMF1/EgtB/PvdO family nonheme iron enzyme [Roseomonas sp. AR75]